MKTLIAVFLIFMTLFLNGCTNVSLEQELSMKKAILSKMQQKQNEYSEKIILAEKAISQYESKKSAIKSEVDVILENNYTRLLYRCITKDIDPSVSAVVGFLTENQNMVFEAGVCYVLSNSDTYVKVQDKLNHWLSIVKEADEKIEKISGELREYKNSLATINPNEINQLQSKISELETKISCEQDFKCKIKSLVDKLTS